MFEDSNFHKFLPDEKIDIYEPHLDLFFQTLFERQLIWKRRFIDKLDKPWTEDPILADNKFTNVYRELDRSSQWQIKNIILDKTLDDQNLLWKIMIYRYFNAPEAFENSIENPWRNGIPDYDEFNEIEFEEYINNVRKTGVNPFTTAYYVNSTAARGTSRNYCYTRLVAPHLHENIPGLLYKLKNSKTPAEIISFIKTFPASGDFIAHEFYQDFTYVDRYTGRKFMKFDQNDFTNVGPGASLGIRLIFPSLKNKRQETGIYVLRDIAVEKLMEISERTGVEFPYLNWDKKNGNYFTTSNGQLTLHQIEMWLCEFQKYWKMMIGQGKQRSKFVEKTNNAGYGVF